MSARLHWPDCWRDPAHHECAVREVIKGRVKVALLRVQHDNLMALCDEQARDEGLWFVAEHVTDAYLQAALRRLHAAIEGGA
jgi:hypothetical protein